MDTPILFLLNALGVFFFTTGGGGGDLTPIHLAF